MIKKLKSSLFSIIPIIAFVLVMHLFVQKIETEVFLNFFIGIGLLIVGQAIFLTGIDKSIEPMGQYVGSSVSSNKRFIVYVIFGFVFGVFATIAEPDMQVFALKVGQSGLNISKTLLLIVVSVGVGAFISLSLVRLVTKWNLKIVLFVSYLVVAVLAFFVTEQQFAMSLDTGASTTGVVTSPFLLALGVGVVRIISSGNTKDEDSFGLIALSSVGPIIASLILCIVSCGDSAGASVASVSTTPLWLETLIDVAFSIIPLVLVFFIFEGIFIKISTQEKKKLLLGTLITFVGFYLFLFGIEFGLSGMGEYLGKIVSGIGSIGLIILICAVLGFFIVFSEPSIKILANQIEEVTNRNIRSKLVVVAIAVSVMISMSICVLRVYYNLSLIWIFGIIYGLAFILVLFVPKLFVAIAFDSSGVATGTLTIGFLFPLIVGLSGTIESGFGIIAIISMMPILVMELLGLIYNIIVKVDKIKVTRIMLKLSKTEDKYSNIEELKIRHEKMYKDR